MKEIGIAKIIVSKRREMGITQDELASCMGVTKASVSKWETGLSYPDILLLPRLATYFNVSIDELMDYTPQLTKEEIRQIYHQLAEEFSKLPFLKAKENCESYVHKYYSCFPFLMQMSILYINHHMLANSKEEAILMLEDAARLCQRVQSESDNASMSQEAVCIEAMVNQILGKPERILELLGEEIKPQMPGAQLIIGAFQMLGNKQKAQQLSQIDMYNHLGELLSIIPTYLHLYMDQPDRTEEIIRRTCGLINLFQAEQIQANSCAIFYYNSAIIRMQQNKQEAALDMLERYTSVCASELTDISLHGDDYFDLLDPWFESFDLGNKVPRSQKIINEDILAGLCQTELFEPLKNTKRYQKMVQTLKKAL